MLRRKPSVGDIWAFRGFGATRHYLILALGEKDAALKCLDGNDNEPKERIEAIVYSDRWRFIA